MGARSMWPLFIVGIFYSTLTPIPEMLLSVGELDRQCPRNVTFTAEWSTAPFDDECLQRLFLRMTAHLNKYLPWEEVLYTLLYSLISLLALIGNGLVILAVVRKKEMRTNRNVLIVNLALSNLMLALTTIPFLWLPSIFSDFVYPNFLCKGGNALPGSNIYCSTLTISFMAIDRYCSIKQIQTKERNYLRACIVSLISWGLSFLLSFPRLIYYDTRTLYAFKDVPVWTASKGTELKSYGWRQCLLAPGAEESDGTPQEEGDNDARTIQLAMSLTQLFFLYVMPLIVLSVFNAKLKRFLKESAKQMNRTRTPAFLSDGSSNVIAHSINAHEAVAAEMLSPAERRRSRTTALLTAMALSYGALWLPFSITSIILDLEVLTNGWDSVIERVDQACKLISLLSLCVNPFLYGYLNSNFRIEFAEIFKSWKLLPAMCYRRKEASNNNYYSAVPTNGSETLIGHLRHPPEAPPPPPPPMRTKVNVSVLSPDGNDQQEEEATTVKLQQISPLPTNAVHQSREVICTLRDADVKSEEAVPLNTVDDSGASMPIVLKFHV